MQIGKTTYILELLRRILQAVGVALQDARRGNARVQPALPVPDRLPGLPHPFLVAHVCAEVLKTSLSREAVEAFERLRERVRGLAAGGGLADF